MLKSLLFSAWKHSVERAFLGWSVYTPLYKKGIKEKQNMSMETTGPTHNYLNFAACHRIAEFQCEYYWISDAYTLVVQ